MSDAAFWTGLALYAVGVIALAGFGGARNYRQNAAPRALSWAGLAVGAAGGLVWIGGIVARMIGAA